MRQLVLTLERTSFLLDLKPDYDKRRSGCKRGQLGFPGGHDLCVNGTSFVRPGDLMKQTRTPRKTALGSVISDPSTSTACIVEEGFDKSLSEDRLPGLLHQHGLGLP